MIKVNLKETIAAGSLALIMAATIAIPFEGEKYVAYPDVGNVWTICNGHTANVKKGDTATKKQCAAFLLADLEHAEKVYDRYVTRQHSDNVKAAVIDFIFNVGEGNFAKSTLLKHLNAGNVTAACAQFTRWKFAAGKDCSIRSNNCYGIVTRRNREKELCLDQNYYLRFAVGPDNVLYGIRPAPHQP